MQGYGISTHTYARVSPLPISKSWTVDKSTCIRARRAEGLLPPCWSKWQGQGLLLGLLLAGALTSTIINTCNSIIIILIVNNTNSNESLTSK